VVFVAAAVRRRQLPNRFSLLGSAGSTDKEWRMRAAQVVRHGEPDDAVAVVDIDVPELTDGTVLVSVSTASLNYGDIARCRGGVATVLAQPPFTLGMDVCGIVEQAAAGLEHWVGQRVVGVTNLAMGGLAEKAIVPVSGLFEAPPELDDREAAAFLLPFHVSYFALQHRARLQPGETVLVLGAASAVGTAAIQVAIALGARVLASAGGHAKGKVCIELGASVAIDSQSDNLFDVVMTHTDDRGADVIFDLVGGEATEQVWTSIAPLGRYLPVGFNDDETGGFTGRALRKVSMGNFSVVGVLLAYAEPNQLMRQFGLNLLGPETGRQVHAALRALVASGALQPVVGRTITLDQVGTALADHAHRRTVGRTVVDLTA
jgi:NADPH:quinone reductase